MGKSQGEGSKYGRLTARGGSICTLVGEKFSKRFTTSEFSTKFHVDLTCSAWGTFGSKYRWYFFFSLSFSLCRFRALCGGKAQGCSIGKKSPEFYSSLCFFLWDNQEKKIFFRFLCFYGNWIIETHYTYIYLWEKKKKKFMAVYFGYLKKFEKFFYHCSLKK